MTNRYKTIACFVLTVLCFSFNAIFAAQYESQQIEKIDVEVVNQPSDATFDNTSVISRIKTRKGDIFSQADFDNDLKILAKEFDHVEPILSTIDGKLYITLKIWPKPSIRSITWEGNCKISTKDLKKELGVSACSVFDRLGFNKAFHKLKTYYVKKGFFEAYLDYTIELDESCNVVDIVICINEGRAGRIKDIVFTNFCPEEEEAILEMMVTKTYFFLTSWYTDSGTYNEDAIQQDRYVILNYLQNQGYADAKVDVDICEAPQDDRIIIIITADKGEIYTFGGITFQGNKLFENDIIERQITFCEGDAYSPDDIRDTQRRITDYYGRRGYIDALVEHEVQLDCESRTYAIDFAIEEGEQYCVGLVKVFGNCTTQTNVILHETLVTPGEIFNLVKLQLTEERLKNIGYFKNVNVYPVRSDGPGGLGGHYRDVHIEVEETITGSFSAGAGVSSVESVFAEFNLTEKNFNYQGFGCIWDEGLGALRGGGEYANISAMVGAKSSKYALSWAKPYFKDTPWLVGFELSRSTNRYISDDYDIKATGLTVHGSHRLNNFLVLGVHWRLFNSYVTLSEHKIHKHNVQLDREIEDVLAQKEKSLEQIAKEVRGLQQQKINLNCKMKEEVRSHGLISALGLTLKYDASNGNRSGFKSTLEQEVAGFGGDHTFMSLGYLNSYFIPVGLNGQIRLRGDMRFIVPLFDTKRYHIPINERLFLGGESTIRGYRVYRLGPKFDSEDPRGGMSLQLLSAEYTRILSKRVSAFVFCDSGHLSFDVWNFGTMWTSVGFGINAKILDQLPPVVIGLGFPLNPDRRSDVKRFFFSVGGMF